MDMSAHYSYRFLVDNYTTRIQYYLYSIQCTDVFKTFYMFETTIKLYVSK